MEPMDYEMESPVALRRDIHSAFAQRTQHHRQALGHQNRTAVQRHNFEHMHVDPLSPQHFYRAPNFPAGVSTHYEAGFSQTAHQSSAPINPPNLPLPQNLPGTPFSDLDPAFTFEPIFDPSLRQADSFHGQLPYWTPAATGATVHPNPSFSTRTNVPPPTESSPMEYPQASPPNWSMQLIGVGNQFQPLPHQLESLRMQNYSGIPELDYSAFNSFHDHSIPSLGGEMARNPDPDPNTARFGAYQHTPPSTSYASVLANLGTQDDVSAHIAQFRSTVIPGRNSVTGLGLHTDSEIATALELYFRTGEFQRAMEGLSLDEIADPGRPLQDFEAFLERFAPQRRLGRPHWAEPRHRGRERSPSRTFRDTSQGDQTRTRNTDPYFMAVAHITSAREQIMRDNFASRRPGRAFERATVKAINGLRDVPIDSLSEEDRTCSICMDPFGETEPINGTSETPVKLPCGHIFGCNCIKTWLKEHCTCPTCRRKLESELVHSHSPSHQVRERIRVAHRLHPDRATLFESSDSSRPTHAPDRATRIRAPRRERDNSHNTPTSRYGGAMSRVHSTGPSDIPEDISPNHPRFSFMRSRSNASSTRTVPSAPRSLHPGLNENTGIDHLSGSSESSMGQQSQRRPRAYLTMTIEPLAASSPRRPVDRGSPAGSSHGHARMGADARQYSGPSRFSSSILANSSTYPANDSPTC